MLEAGTGSDKKCSCPSGDKVTGAEGLHVLRTIFAFYEAARTGRAQTV